MKPLLSALAIALVAGCMRSDVVLVDKYAGYKELVAETHKNSLIARENSYRLTAKHSSGLPGVWGANNWSLSQLMANENLEDVNARLRTTAETYLSEYAIYAPKRAALDAQKLAEENAPGYVEPITRAGLKARRVKYRLAKPQYPWQYFDIADYVRMIYMFGADSTFFPGRLTPETETVMKEALWNKHKGEVVSSHSLDNIIGLRGTENQDMTKGFNIYLMAELFAKDPKFKDRKYGDGSSVSEMLKVLTVKMREWPRKRAMTGIWIELGSSNYQKYSWPALFNMADLALDPIVKKRFTMLLDLAFIEEAQISFMGSRGGGGSRGVSCQSRFQGYKNLFYAPQDGFRGISIQASHTKVLEASSYQLPAAAILLRKREFPVAEPFLIQNRFLGEIVPPTPEKPSSSQFKVDGSLVNYTWRTPYSLLGGVHWDPRLRYGAISDNGRYGSMLFNEANDILKVGVRHATFITWQHVIGYQDKNVMLLQRYQNPYSIKFVDSNIERSDNKNGWSFGKGPLEKNTVEKNGWIFTGNGKAFVAIKFLDHKYFWERRPLIKGTEDTNWSWAHNEDKNEAKKKCSDKDCSCRVLLISGDIDTDNSFEAFVEKVLSQKLTVTADLVKYQADEKSPMLEFFRYDLVSKGKSFELPKINGKTLNLKPEMTYQSPYLNAKSGEDRITVTVGPIKQIYDFGKSTIRTIRESL